MKLTVTQVKLRSIEDNLDHTQKKACGAKHNYGPKSGKLFQVTSISPNFTKAAGTMFLTVSLDSAQTLSIFRKLGRLKDTASYIKQLAKIRMSSHDDRDFSTTHVIEKAVIKFVILH